MKEGWRNYISPHLLKCEKQLRFLHLFKFIRFLKYETIIVYYKAFKLKMMHSFNDKFELAFELFYIEPNNKNETHVLNCTLQGLWVNNPTMKGNTENLFYGQGDYYQSSLNRENKDFRLSPDVSFAATFQEIIRNKRKEFGFIKGLFSTSKNVAISKGGTLSDKGYMFWEKQVANKLAVWIDGEKRFKAILNN
jgi:hypothetical protein